jgi:hypothetical protein
MNMWAPNARYIEKKYLKFTVSYLANCQSLLFNDFVSAHLYHYNVNHTKKQNQSRDLGTQVDLSTNLQKCFFACMNRR